MSELIARIGGGVAGMDPEAWDGCAGTANPFVSHAFLSALEESESVGPRTGWQPAPVSIERRSGAIEAVLPAYLKSHSQGEYVFDHGWADAFERAGGEYYPKLQIAVPFTPVPGPRLLAADEALAPALIRAAEAVVAEHGLSSAHATFVEDAQLPLFEQAGWLIRCDAQFHWTNDGYGSFEDFLASLSSRKRKAIRKERSAALDGIEVAHLTGADIKEAHWDAFWAFYQDTGSRKWGRPYLTRRFFSLIGERMAERLLLVLALRDGRPLAGALNLVGEEALYGRYWGTLVDLPHLHFEICYHQAIEFAIARGLRRVEAGAQGAHKLSRGYRPVPTWSAHFIPDPNFKAAVERYLAGERRAVAREIEALEELTPFRRG